MSSCRCAAKLGAQYCGCGSRMATARTTQVSFATTNAFLDVARHGRRQRIASHLPPAAAQKKAPVWMSPESTGGKFQTVTECRCSSLADHTPRSCCWVLPPVLDTNAAGGQICILKIRYQVTLVLSMS